MKADKRKLTVIGMLLVIVIFIIVYTIMIMKKTHSDHEDIEETQVPSLEEEPREYDSRLKAVDNLVEETTFSPPGLYDEDLIDKDGVYDPYLEEKEKVALMDSILDSGPDLEDYYFEEKDSVLPVPGISPTLAKLSGNKSVSIGQGHDLFFIESKEKKSAGIAPVERLIRVAVNGDQLVRKDERLELRLIDPLVFQGDTIHGNTLLYAFCSFQPNRLLLKVHEVGNFPVQLEAYDISDGQKGIYIENSFRSQTATQVIDDVIRDINVSGVPQVSGLKGIFQRSNRSVKVKVLHQYQLYLKPVL